MFNIYFLKFTSNAMTNLPKAKRSYNEHYVLSYKNSFFVMTSKPVIGLNNTFIHRPNIENQTNKDQYVVINRHTYNPELHEFYPSTKGSQYLIDHKDKFEPVLKQLQEVE